MAYGVYHKLSQLLKPALSCDVIAKEFYSLNTRHSLLTCQVPTFSLPSVTGMVRDAPRKQAFTCAGCNGGDASDSAREFTMWMRRTQTEAPRSGRRLRVNEG